jgi:hypothetical protein
MASNLDNNQIPSNAILRLFFVVLLNIINMVVSKLILLVAFYEFLCHLLTGRVPAHGVRWGVAMSNWTYQMMLFMTYKTERMPFPLHRLGPDPE